MNAELLAKVRRLQEAARGIVLYVREHGGPMDYGGMNDLEADVESQWEFQPPPEEASHAA